MTLDTRMPTEVTAIRAEDQSRRSIPQAANTLCFCLDWRGPNGSDIRDDLGPFLRQMGNGDRLALAFRRTTTAKGVDQDVMIRISEGGDASKDRNAPHRGSLDLADLTNSLQALLGSYVLIPVDDVDRCAGSRITRQTPRNVLAANEPATELPSLFRPTPVRQDTDESVVLTDVPGGSKVDIAAALGALVRLREDFELVVTCDAFDLSLPEQVAISRAMRGNLLDHDTYFTDPGLARRRSITLEILRSWISRPSGVRFDARLYTTAPDQERLSAVVSQLLFPQSGQIIVDSSLANHVVDLSCCVNGGSPMPQLLPAHAELDRLSFLQLRSEGSRNERPSLEFLLARHIDGAPKTLTSQDLSRHTAVVGSTGVGKSSFLKHLIEATNSPEASTVVIDPHGDLVNDVLDGLPECERQRLVIADVSGQKGAFSIPLLDSNGPDPIYTNFVCNQLISIFKNVLYRQQPEGFGPMFEAYFRNALMLLMLSEGNEANLADLERVFHDSAFRRKLLESCTDKAVVGFWRGIAQKATGETSLEGVAPYVVSKLTQFTGNPLVRPIISGCHNEIDLTDVVDNRKVLLVNLARGSAGEIDANLIGALFTIQLFSTLLKRGRAGNGERSAVHIFLDEFQGYTTDALGQMLAESRKFGGRIVLATQSLNVLDRSAGRMGTAASILANVGNVVAFRSGPQDARILSDWFAPSIAAEMLTMLPDRVFAGRIMTSGIPERPRLYRTVDV